MSGDDYVDDDDDWIWDVEMPGENEREKRSFDDMNDDEEEMVGGGLFSFDIREGVMPQRWRNIVHKTRHTARLQQTREIRDGDRLGNAMSEAVRLALVSIVSKHPNLKDDDAIHFTMQSNAFAQRTNHCFQSCQFRVDEIGDDEEGSSTRFDAYMDQLAKQLNSSQSFSPGDDFSLEVTTIRMPEEGGRSKKYDVAKAKVRDIQKRSRVVIKNKDNLCCLRATVTMRAWSDEKANQFPPSSYRSLRDGLPCQKVQALQLGREAGVSTTEPLGLADIEKIQRVLSPIYQIKVMKIGRPHMIVYVGPEAQRRIFLVLEDGHYDGTTSLKGMFNKSYFCHYCDRGYDIEDIEHHPCEGRRCKSCQETECTDWLTERERAGEGGFVHPTTKCSGCHRSFFGRGCHALHKTVDGRKKSMCQRLKKCPQCCKGYMVEFNAKGNRTTPPHRCGFGECAHCEKVVDLYEHQCFIQKVKKKEDEPKTKKVPRNEVRERRPLGPPKNGLVEVEREPPALRVRRL